MEITNAVVNVPRAANKGMMECYYARPQASGLYPGVIVIHEIFGLNDNIRQITDRFAEQGYASLAIDLFSNRNRAMCMMKAFYGVLVKPLNNATLSDLHSSMDFLRQLPCVDPERTGAVGFCMGGGYALQLSVTQKGLKAASVFYGASPKPMDVMAQACPINGSFPDKDFTTQSARELEAVLTKASVPHDIKFYENTQHSFFNKQRTPFEVEASKDAWERLLAFFDEHLVHAK
jgi:carboxymethylenebutenolidase